jgi:hypothetical protein
MDQDYRHLRADKLIETAERLARRIKDRFPTSNLANVASTVVDVAREAVVRAERIREPNWWLRGGLIAFGVLSLVGVIAVGWQMPDTYRGVGRVMEFLRATSGAAIYLGAAVIFLVTLERRFKRGRAIKAIHELRALAHIIDMHQLTKDPDRIAPGGKALLETGETMTAEAMGHYLNYCTELLAIVSKIGQLYVEDFADSTTLAAVDQLENLAVGLSQKVWQKLMILDRVRAGAEPAPGSPLAQ